ncbi:MAG: hypothetical protein ACKVXR_00880 [Planctomycetota bacterium]
MKRILLVLAGAVILFLVGRAIVRALVSDETKIRWAIEDMREGFDETRMDPILVAFDEKFRDETSGADRADVRQALAYLFLTAKHPQTKAFPYRVEIEIPKIGIEDSDPPAADCDLDARFFDLRGGGEEVAWEITIHSRWTRGEYGWRIASTRYETKSGRMLR